ncbi:MAG: iron chelate uptake ABC transporter family permease subunit [Bacteroidales bacterium]
MQRRKKSLFIYTALTILLVLFFIADLLIGSQSISLQTIFKIIFCGEETPYSEIILYYRLPKIIAAVVVGMSLSISGLQMQTVFRNPLADPYILGVSSGAGLGVALLIMGSVWCGSLNMALDLSDVSYAFAACVGSVSVMMLMLFISLRIRNIMAMLILGMMIGSAAAALITVLQYFSQETMLKSYMLWTMGNLGNLTLSQLYVMLIVCIIGGIFSLLFTKILNALMLGESYAQSIGYGAIKYRSLIILNSSLLTGTVTAFCGPIGFIGIAVPHVARLLICEADHRYLMPTTILLGGVLMLICDMLSQLPFQNSVLPINTVTALLGIPIIIFVIMRNQKIV